MKSRVVFLFCIIFLHSACSKKLVPDAGAAKKETAVADMTLAGKNIYLSKCGRCHALKDPGDFTRQQWIPIMDRMAVKAKLSDAEKVDVLSYVQTNTK